MTFWVAGAVVVSSAIGSSAAKGAAKTQAAAADRAGQGTAAVARASATGSCLAIVVLPGFPPARRSPRMGRPTPTHG